MSIQSEINRISDNVSDALDAIAAKGVTVPSGSNSDDLAELISQIQGGGMQVVETPDPAGGTVLTITGKETVLQAKTNIAPTLSSQTIEPDTGYDGLSSVQINAVSTGTAGTPTAAKGTVSNHSVSVTPSVTNTTGYISGGTKSGTAVTVSASELVSGSQTVTSNDTYDVTNLASMIVNVSGGTSAWTLIDHREVTTSQTSTTASTAATISCGSGGYTKDRIIWVHVRDKAGKRAGYFYGSDAFFVNYQKAQGGTTTLNVPAVLCMRYTTASAFAATAGQYGVYGYSINSSGSLIVRKRYNSSYSLTIDGTYVIDTYYLDLPSGITLFP